MISGATQIDEYDANLLTNHYFQLAGPTLSLSVSSQSDLSTKRKPERNKRSSWVGQMQYVRSYNKTKANSNEPTPHKETTSAHADQSRRSTKHPASVPTTRRFPNNHPTATSLLLALTLLNHSSHRSTHGVSRNTVLFSSGWPGLSFICLLFQV